MMDLVLSQPVDCEQFEIVTELLVRGVRRKALTKRCRRYTSGTQIVVTRNGQVGIGDLEFPAGEPHVPQVAPFSSLRKGTELLPHDSPTSSTTVIISIVELGYRWLVLAADQCLVEPGDEGRLTAVPLPQVSSLTYHGLAWPGRGAG